MINPVTVVALNKVEKKYRADLTSRLQLINSAQRHNRTGAQNGLKPALGQFAQRLWHKIAKNSSHTAIAFPEK